MSSYSLYSSHFQSPVLGWIINTGKNAPNMTLLKFRRIMCLPEDVEHSTRCQAPENSSSEPQNLCTKKIWWWRSYCARVKAEFSQMNSQCVSSHGCPLHWHLVTSAPLTMLKEARYEAPWLTRFQPLHLVLLTPSLFNLCKIYTFSAKDPSSEALWRQWPQSTEILSGMMIHFYWWQMWVVIFM